MKDPVAGLRKIFERPGPPLRLERSPVTIPRRYERSETTSAVYFAQLVAMATIPHRTLAGQVEMQDYADEVLSMPWPRWHAGPMWPVTIQVVPGLTAETGTALYANGVIYVPPVVSELIVLHEIAHHLAPVFTGAHGTLVPQFHGKPFVQAYLDLVEHVMNPAARGHFAACFAAEGVST